MEDKAQGLLILSVVEDNLNELEEWSVDNEESYLELIQAMQKIAKLIKSDLTEDHDKTF